VAYNPGTAANPLPEGRVVAGTRPPDISEMANGLSVQAKTLMEGANAATAELRVALVQTTSLLRTLNSGASASSDHLVGALDELRRSIQRVDLLLAQNGPVASDALRGMRDATVQADSMTRTLAHAGAQVDSILAKVNSGQGLAGTLINDTTTARELMRTNEALRSLLADFQANPGRYIRLRIF